MKYDSSSRKDVSIVILNILVASLSITGNTLILFKILRDWTKNGSTTPYDRFILGLSCYDILYSITAIKFPFLIGNPSQAICRVRGISGMISFGTYWYNGLLSCCFLITVLSQLRRKNLMKRFEPWMHLSAMYFPIGAILSFIFGWYRPNDLGTACKIDTVSLMVAVAIPLVLALLLMIVNYSVLYAVVRKQLKSSNESSENVDGSTPVRNQIFRETTKMWVLYVGSFLISWLPDVIFFIINYSEVDEGIFNVIIYLTPFYNRFRAAYPNKSKCFVLRQAVMNSKAPRLLHRRIGNHITHRSDVLITDITLGEDRVMNPSQALFYPGFGRSSSPSDPSANAVADTESGRLSDRTSEKKAREEESDLELKTEMPRKKSSWLMTDHSGVRRVAMKTDEDAEDDSKEDCKEDESSRNAKEEN